ncbi:hypothetical protein [Methanoplanus endosymbiosus]|uniref:Uncharacterized protein n=1 Tax=Methanoplanus endosymbiosus TaxID=33865 RepID=A0A9E7TJN4_9EURY|nr:hypothetical protein [Methanoplanus endosymbiosus]UUX91994.1 hypothetical protein L6E24_11590 [Methanoplanus endosymbiosus]
MKYLYPSPAMTGKVNRYTTNAHAIYIPVVNNIPSLIIRIHNGAPSS